jgi:hypothetical protein
MPRVSSLPRKECRTFGHSEAKPKNLWASFMPHPVAQVDTLFRCRHDQRFFTSAAKNAAGFRMTGWRFGDAVEESLGRFYAASGSTGGYPFPLPA